MLALLRTQLAIRMLHSYALPKDVGRDGGEGQRAVAIRWREDVPVQGDITLGRKVGGAGRIENNLAGQIEVTPASKFPSGWGINLEDRLVRAGICLSLPPSPVRHEHDYLGPLRQRVGGGRMGAQPHQMRGE